eukprot:2420159-Amphidinium_carterae.1
MDASSSRLSDVAFRISQRFNSLAYLLFMKVPIINPFTPQHFAKASQDETASALPHAQKAARETMIRPATLGHQEVDPALSDLQ